MSEVLNGKRPLTLAMMRSLNKNLGLSAEVLLKEPGAGFPEEMQDLEWQRFPVVEMAKRCWLLKVDDIKEKAEELVRGFIAQAGGLKMIPTACFRKSKGARYNSKMDPYALSAWCIRVLALAQENPLKSRYVKGSIKQNTLRKIARLSYFENGPLLAREYLEKQGIHLIVVPHLPKTYLDGAAMLAMDPGFACNIRQSYQMACFVKKKEKDTGLIPDYLYFMFGNDRILYTKIGTAGTE